MVFELKYWCRRVIVGAFVVFSLSQTLIAQNLDQIGKKNGIKVSGGASANQVFQASDNRMTSMQPYTYYLSGNITANVYGISIPVSFNYSNRKFNYQQPFNIVGISPHYKWVTVHAGYRSMAFGQYSLAGLTYFGGGIEMKPPKSNVEIMAMSGRLAKATPIDSGSGSRLPSYQRWGTGMKMKINGKKQTLGLVWFYASDNVRSQPVPLDSFGISPKENLVYSADLTKTLFKKLNFAGEMAVSGLTGDTRFKGSATTNNSPLSSLFFINKNGTTRYYKAYKASLGYTFTAFTVGVAFEHIDPGYMTLGAFYFNNDVESYSLNMGTRLFKGKVNLSGRTGLQRDNLDKAKLSDSRRWANALSMSFAPSSKVSMNVAYSNFQNITNIRPALINPNVGNTFIPPDTLNYVQITQSLTASSNFNLSKSNEKVSAITVTASAQGTGEKKGTNVKIVPGAKIYNSSLSYGFKNGKNSPMIGLSLACNRMDAGIVKQTTIGPGVTISKPLWKDKLRGSFGVNAGNVYTNGTSGGLTSNFNLSLSCSPAKHHNISFSSIFSRRETKTLVETNVNRNFTASLNYSYSF